MNDVVVVVRESWPKESLDIFEYEPLWSYVSNSADCLWKQVAVIGAAQVFASDGKGLTWRTTRHEMDPSLVLLEVMVANVALYDLPVPHMFDSVRPVAPQCAAGVAVPIEDSDVLESGAGHAESESSGTNEEFKGIHGKVIGGLGSTQRALRSEVVALRSFDRRTFPNRLAGFGQPDSQQSSHVMGGAAVLRQRTYGRSPWPPVVEDLDDAHAAPFSRYLRRCSNNRAGLKARGVYEDREVASIYWASRIERIDAAWAMAPAVA